MEHVLRHDGIALPPCPRCGCRPEIVEGELGYFIRCPKESCEISTGEYATLVGAIRAWGDIDHLWNPLLCLDPEEEDIVAHGDIDHLWNPLLCLDPEEDIVAHGDSEEESR